MLRLMELMAAVPLAYPQFQAGARLDWRDGVGGLGSPTVVGEGVVGPPERGIQSGRGCQGGEIGGCRWKEWEQDVLRAGVGEERGM